MDRVCPTCRWWEAVSKNFGKCRRYPPIAGPDNSSFPLTGPSDQCGEWSLLTVQQMNERAKASEDTTSAEG